MCLCYPLILGVMKERIRQRLGIGSTYKAKSMLMIKLRKSQMEEDPHDAEFSGSEEKAGQRRKQTEYRKAVVVRVDLLL